MEEESVIAVEKVALPAGLLLTGAWVGHIVGKDTKFGGLRSALAGGILPLSIYAVYQGKECKGRDCGWGNFLFAGSGLVFVGAGLGMTYSKQKVSGAILGAVAGLGAIFAIDKAL